MTFPLTTLLVIYSETCYYPALGNIYLEVIIQTGTSKANGTQFAGYLHIHRWDMGIADNASIVLHP